MNFKKTKVAVASGLMAASMVLAPLAAYADTVTPTEIGSDDKITVNKTVKVPNGTTIDKNVEFSVTQIRNSTDGVLAPNETAKGNFTALNGLTDSDTTHVFSTKDKTDASKDGNNEDRDLQYKTTSDLDFSKVIAPGEYTFEIAETGKDGSGNEATENLTKDANGYGWTVDDSKYVLRVYVDKDKKKRYTMQKLTRNDQGEYVAGDNKNDAAEFVNEFTKPANDINDKTKSLVIEKKVKNNEYADPNMEFVFDITFTEDEGSLAKVPSVIKYKINNGGDEKELTDVVAGTKINGAFKLKANESIVFTNLPAGIYYTVEEHSFTNKQSTGYVATSNNIGTSNADSNKVEMQLIGEDTNSAEFTNTFIQNVITGVVTHSAPFVIMVGALFVAVGGYVVLKKRIEE